MILIIKGGNSDVLYNYTCVRRKKKLKKIT